LLTESRLTGKSCTSDRQYLGTAPYAPLCVEHLKGAAGGFLSLPGPPRDPPRPGAVPDQRADRAGRPLNGRREEPTMAKIEKYSAAGVYDPPGYSQGVRVTGAQTILFLAGQVAYDKDGSVKHRGDFKAQAREVVAAVKALAEAGGGSLASVVKMNTHGTDRRDPPDGRRARDA